MKLKYIYIIIIVVTQIPFWDANAQKFERPLVGIAGIEVDSLRVQKIGSLVVDHLHNILYTVGVFEQINPELLRTQLLKFGCLEDTCITRFARDAGVSAIIRGSIEDKGENIILTLKAIGVDLPYEGKIIHTYKVLIPLQRNKYTIKHYSYIAEEHAGSFIAEMLATYVYPVYAQKGKKGEIIFPGISEEGDYQLYKIILKGKKDTAGYYLPVKDIYVSNSVTTDIKQLEDAEYFVLKSFKEKSTFLEDFYYGRKKELVFEKESFSATLYAMLFTPIVSGVMPIAAPVGYYSNRDYQGLGLWALNGGPYMYLTYSGLRHRPGSMRDDHEDIKRSDKTNYYFALYQSACGGISLFADATARYALEKAAAYGNDQAFMGNDYTAVYLAFISGGAGHFYRGYRGWGYFYYHLDNILLYTTLYYYFADEIYNSQTGEYEKGKSNKKIAYTTLGVFSVVKIIEIIHVLYLKDNIANGHMLDTAVSISPASFVDGDNELIVGIQCTYAY